MQIHRLYESVSEVDGEEECMHVRSTLLASSQVSVVNTTEAHSVKDNRLSVFDYCRYNPIQAFAARDSGYELFTHCGSEVADKSHSSIAYSVSTISRC